MNPISEFLTGLLQGATFAIALMVLIILAKIVVVIIQKMLPTMKVGKDAFMKGWRGERWEPPATKANDRGGV